MNLRGFFSKSFGASSSTANNEQSEFGEEVSEEENESADSVSENEILSPRKRQKSSHKPPGGGQTKFQPEYAQIFSAHTIERGKKDGHFCCRACGSEYTLAKRADLNIQRHTDTEKHKKNLIEYNRSRPLSDFVRTKKPSQIKQELAAELTMAFHCARHNHSVRSADCSSELFPTVFAGSSAAANFASKRAKTTAILNGVIAPFLKNRILREIDEAGGYFSVGLDSTSLNETRMFAVVVRYFNCGTKTRVLELIEQPGEKSAETVALLKQALFDNKLNLQKMVSICMDNTNSTFGGQRRRGRQNKVLNQEHPGLVGVNCPSHVSNNAVRFAIEQFDDPVVQFANTVTSHFSNSALRWERYTEFCEEQNLQVRVLPDFAPTRWLTLGRLCDEIVRSWPALEAYFRSESDCPKFLKKIFNDEEVLSALKYRTIFQFFSFALAIFNRFNSISQTPSLPFPSLIKSLSNLKMQLRTSLDETNFGSATVLLFEQMDDEGAPELCTKLRTSFTQFYKNSLDYLDRWTGTLSEIGEFAADWLIFEAIPSSKLIQAAYRKYCSKEDKELDELFIEICSLKNHLDKLNATAFADKNVDEKWAILFKDPSYVHLKKLVTMLLSIFSSNAYCESVFSVVKNIKTDERNRMKIKLLNSLVSTKLNSDFDCIQAYKLFISDPDLLNKVKTNDKYAE